MIIGGVIAPPAFQSIMSRHFQAPDENHLFCGATGGYSGFEHKWFWMTKKELRYPSVVFRLNFFFYGIQYFLLLFFFMTTFGSSIHRVCHWRLLLLGFGFREELSFTLHCHKYHFCKVAFSLALLRVVVWCGFVLCPSVSPHKYLLSEWMNAMTQLLMR